MDDKLILAVFNYPELYNVTLPNYRCTESRANAWRSISVVLGLPCECLIVFLFITTLLPVIILLSRCRTLVTEQTGIRKPSQR